MSSHSHRMSSTTALAAKVGVASAALAGVASLARLAVPHLVSVGGAVVPRVWAVARFWLAPPYLFVTVHLIILVIWKLSDNKHFHQTHKDPWPAVASHQHQHPPAGAVDEVAPPAAVKALPTKEEEEDFGHLDGEEFPPDSGDSCVTTESDEDASSAPSFSYSSVEASRSVFVASVHQERAVLERDLSLPSSQTVDGGDGDDDDLDATWNAIMQKTRSAPPTAPAPASPPPPAQQQSPTRPPPRARDPSVGAEEMNRRFDDFIKKNRNSFGRQ